MVSNNDMGLEMGTLDGHGSRYTYLVFISLPVLFDSSTLSPEEMKEERNTVRERERERERDLRFNFWFKGLTFPLGWKLPTQ